MKIPTVLLKDLPMEAAQVFPEANGRNFREAGKWDRRLPFTSIETARVSGLSSDAMKPVQCRRHVADGSVWIACIPMGN